MPSPLHPAFLPEQPVTDDRRASWLAKLLQDRTFRTTQIEQLDAEMRGSLGRPSDTVARIVRAGAWAALKEIDDALARLFSGRFGRCISCGQPIGLDRLDVLPMTSHCMPCQFESELHGR